MFSSFLTNLFIKELTDIDGASYAFWDVLLTSIEDVIALTRKILETKEHILHTEYLGRRRTTVVVFEVPCYLLVEYLAAYLL